MILYVYMQTYALHRILIHRNCIRAVIHMSRYQGEIPRWSYRGSMRYWHSSPFLLRIPWGAWAPTKSMSQSVLLGSEANYIYI